MSRALLIPQDGSPAREVEWSDTDDMARLLGSQNGLVERVVVGNHRTRERLMGVVMVVRESGRFEDDVVVNQRASILYGSYMHGTPVVGDVLLVGERGDPMEGYDFCGLSMGRTVSWLDTYLGSLG